MNIAFHDFVDIINFTFAAFIMVISAIFFYHMVRILKRKRYVPQIKWWYYISIGISVYWFCIYGMAILFYEHFMFTSMMGAVTIRPAILVTLTAMLLGYLLNPFNEK